jgi:hypothetical protein
MMRRKKCNGGRLTNCHDRMNLPGQDEKARNQAAERLRHGVAAVVRSCDSSLGSSQSRKWIACPMTKNASALNALGLAALSMLFAGLWPALSQACSLISVEWSTEESIRISIYYWMGSAVVGAMCIAAGLYRGRWILTLVVVVAVLIFHPSWTVRPVYGPDCTFANVEASQASLILVGFLLSYHLFRIVRARRRLPASS